MRVSSTRFLISTLQVNFKDHFWKSPLNLCGSRVPLEVLVVVWPLEICLIEIESNSFVNHARWQFAIRKLISSRGASWFELIENKKTFYNLRDFFSHYSLASSASHNKHVFIDFFLSTNLRCVQHRRHFSSEFYCCDELKNSCGEIQPIFWHFMSEKYGGESYVNQCKQITFLQVAKTFGSMGGLHGAKKYKPLPSPSELSIFRSWCYSIRQLGSIFVSFFFFGFYTS